MEHGLDVDRPRVGPILMLERIQDQIRSLPEVRAWPELASIVDRSVHLESLSAWEYPLRACEAVGGRVEAALPGAAAIFCAVKSIHLVDDMLDEDPGGEYRHLGSGAAANLALALMGAAHRLLAAAPLPPESAVEAQRSLAAMNLATAWGQRQDAEGADGEDVYWRVVEAKTPPLFASALTVGALLGGASPARAGRLAELGALIGKLVQVNDDLGDALRTPAGADWRRPRNSLPLLYALTAEHGDREDFGRLVPRVTDPDSLLAAQRILFRSGAVSYCAFKIFKLADEGRALLGVLPLDRPEPLRDLLEAQVQPLDGLLSSLGPGLPHGQTAV